MSGPVPEAATSVVHHPQVPVRCGLPITLLEVNLGSKVLFVKWIFFTPAQWKLVMLTDCSYNVNYLFIYLFLCLVIRVVYFFSRTFHSRSF